MSQYQTKSFIERLLEKIIISGVLSVVIGLIIIIVQTMINPSKIFQVETLSFSMIFLGIGLIAIMARILERLS